MHNALEDLDVLNLDRTNSLYTLRNNVALLLYVDDVIFGKTKWYQNVTMNKEIKFWSEEIK